MLIYLFIQSFMENLIYLYYFKQIQKINMEKKDI